MSKNYIVYILKCEISVLKQITLSPKKNSKTCFIWPIFSENGLQKSIFQKKTKKLPALIYIEAVATADHDFLMTGLVVIVYSHRNPVITSHRVVRPKFGHVRIKFKF